jgi:hypothetical protein
MVDVHGFTQVVTALPGVTSAPHFDRTAFKVKRIFATLAADGSSVNLKLTPDEQEFKCMLAPSIFSALDNAWGKQGWTQMRLDIADEAEVAAALAMAHAHATGRSPK